MVSFECSFEVRTRQDAVWALQEMISQIEGDNYFGYFSYAEARGQALEKKNQRKKISKNYPNE